MKNLNLGVCIAILATSGIGRLEASGMWPLVGSYEAGATLRSDGAGTLKYSDIQLRIGRTGRVLGSGEKTSASGVEPIRTRGRFRAVIRRTSDGPELLSRFRIRFSDGAVTNGRVDTLLGGRDDRVASFKGEMANGELSGTLTAIRLIRSGSN